MSGTVTNIILDYVCIFPLSMGIKGAAIATGLGQIVTVAIVLPHFIKSRFVFKAGLPFILGIIESLSTFGEFS